MILFVTVALEHKAPFRDHHFRLGFIVNALR